jgi:ribosomal protein S18 acetylase RimI-like enzyme
MPVEIKLVSIEDEDVLQHVAAEVFDGQVNRKWTHEFLADQRHHLIVARDNSVVVGMITGVDYVHPDKAPQLWINEIGVAPTHQQQGIGRKLLEAMLAHGRSLGCTEAWVGTEETNVAATRLYESSGGVAEPLTLYSFRLNEKSPLSSR